MSYSKIEHAACEVRRVIAPNRTITQPLPVLNVFERLNFYRVTVGNKDLPVDYEVIDLPIGVEALTRYDNQRQEIVVALSSLTYENLERGDARARLTACHEIGHAVLHSAELVRLSQLPHRQAAFLRGEWATHEICQDTEWQATAFGSALLMPARGLAELEKQGKLNIAAIQRHFQVSALAAEVRRDIFQRKRDELLKIK